MILEKKDFQKCTFIMDRDYDPDLEMTGYSISASEKKRVLLTKGHSLENYLLYGDNWDCFLKTIKKQFPEVSSDIEELYGSLLAFFKTHLKFFVEKATIIKGVEYLGKPKFSNGNSHNSIFIYSFPDNIVNEYMYRNELRRMEKYIEENDLEPEADNYKKLIRKNPLLYIRGHDIYEYIRGFLLYYCNVNIGPFLNADITMSLRDNIRVEWDRF